MDPHTEQPADVIPDLSLDDNLSFESALDQAFASLDAPAAAAAAAVAPEAAAEPEAAAAAAEPEAAAADADPIEDLTDDIGDDWTPKAAARFQKLKAELKSSSGELESLRQKQLEYDAKIEELTGKAESNDSESLRTRVAEYEKKQMFTSLETTDAYKEAVSKPLAALIAQADAIADKYDVDKDALTEILSLSDADAQEEQLNELLPNASDRDKAKVFRLMEDLTPIVERRKSLYENADEALAEAKLSEEKKTQADAAERAATRANVTRNVIERVQQKLPFIKTIDGLDLQAIQEAAANSDPAVIHPVDYAFNAVSAKILPAIVKEYAAMRKEAEALTERLAAYEDAEPKAGGHDSTAARTATAREGLSFGEAIESAFAGR